MRNLTLGRRLLLLALAGILPLAAMSGIALIALVHQQHIQTEIDCREITRALAIAVDGEVQRSIAALSTLATANSLDAGNIDRFLQRAERFKQTQPHWQVIILADPQGKVLFNTNFVGNPPPIVDRESFDETVRSGRPIVGDLASSRDQLGRFGVPLRVPVIQNGELRYILTGIITSQAILDVIERQHVPPEWVVSVFDRKGVRVARSRLNEQFIGLKNDPGVQELMSSGADEGAGITTRPGSEPAYTAYTRLKNIGWTVVIGIPATIIDKAGYRSLAVYGGGLLLSVALGALASLLMARSINRPIGQLRKAAQSLGRGESVDAVASDIPETREVADALAVASRQLAAHATEREKLLAATETARRQAETANRAKDEFLAMLGHELRNPLASIVNALQLMNARSHAADARERQIISRQIAHLTHLVDDLLDVSRITKGKVQLQRRPLDMRTIVNRALELSAPILDKRERPVDVELPPEAVPVLGDEVRLAQVLSNLLVNAAKFTPNDGRIALRLNVADGMAKIAVEDDGNGIAADLLPHVFEVFMQGRQPIDRQAGGLGLGLAIVKALVDMHGGTAKADSKGLGQGSTFTVRLPTISSAALPATAGTRPAPHVPRDRRRILVVDDNVDAAETLAQLLREAAGYEVWIETNGLAALASLDRFAPEVAILDIGLPGMTGYELARKLRADPRLPDLRIVAMTGYGARQDRSRALESGFDEHLTKPVALARLLDAIERIAGEASKPTA
jgi:signal transduction histidine kinase/ActR/RegA family two-component response regulator